MFFGEKWKSKSQTNSLDFYPERGVQGRKIKVFTFLDELDHSDHLYNLLVKKHLFHKKSYGNLVDPSMENSITFNVFFYWNLPLTKQRIIRRVLKKQIIVCKKPIAWNLQQLKLKLILFWHLVYWSICSIGLGHKSSPSVLGATDEVVRSDNYRGGN